MGGVRAAPAADARFASHRRPARSRASFSMAVYFIAFFCAVHLPSPDIWKPSVLFPFSGDLLFTPETVPIDRDVISIPL
jgi:hypothetical protein